MTIHSTPPEHESRRKFIKGLSIILGGTVASGLLTGNAYAVAMTYSPTQSHSTAGKIFTVEQLKLLEYVCAIVIPKTATLGAAEVDTHGFIDSQLYHCHSKQTQNKIMALLTDIDEMALSAHSAAFIKLSYDQQFSLLTKLDIGDKPFSQAQRTDFKSLKQLICFGYYTSEVGASQELRFDAIPGGFKGSIPYSKDQASWGSNALFY